MEAGPADRKENEGPKFQTIVKQYKCESVNILQSPHIQTVCAGVHEQVGRNYSYQWQVSTIFPLFTLGLLQ